MLARKAESSFITGRCYSQRRLRSPKSCSYETRALGAHRLHTGGRVERCTHHREVARHSANELERGVTSVIRDRSASDARSGKGTTSADVAAEADGMMRTY